MFEALSKSWELAGESLKVLRKGLELMVFPVISFIAGVVVAGVLGGIGFATGGFAGDQGIIGLGILLIFLFYFGAYFVTIYFQVALVASVKLQLSGGNPTLGYGSREATKRLGSVVTWAVIVALVGLLFRLLEEVARRNTTGWGRIRAQVVIGLVGMAWSLATFFVIPMIAYEGVGGFQAVKRSIGVVKRRWGEVVVGQAGIMMVMWILAMGVGAVFGVIGILALSGGGTARMLVVGGIFLAIAVLGVLFIIALASTLQSVCTAVLYEYVTVGRVGEQFSRDVLVGAFRPAPLTA